MMQLGDGHSQRRIEAESSMEFVEGLGRRAAVSRVFCDEKVQEAGEGVQARLNCRTVQRW